MSSCLAVVFTTTTRCLYTPITPDDYGAHPTVRVLHRPHLPKNTVACDDILDHLVVPNIPIEAVAVELRVGLDVH